MDIHYLTSNAELYSIFPLVRQHHTTMKDEDFESLIQEMKETGYRTIGAFKDQRLCATVGFWIGVRFYCGKYMYINNFIVDNTIRGQGIGSYVMNWLEEEAKKLGCKAIVLDSYVNNHAAHKFYIARNYVINNFHFKKDL